MQSEFIKRNNNIINNLHTSSSPSLSLSSSEVMLSRFIIYFSFTPPGKIVKLSDFKIRYNVTFLYLIKSLKIFLLYNKLINLKSYF